MWTILRAIALILVIVGAWKSMKSSPAFSRRRVFRLGMGVAALLGVFGLGTYFAITALPKSSTVQFAALGLVLLGTPAALIAMTMKVWEDKLEMPKTARVGRIHRKRLWTWVGPFLLVSASFPAIALLTSAGGESHLWAASIVIPMVSLLVLLILYLQAARLDRTLAALQARPWFCWSYAPEEWAAWRDAELERLRAAQQSIDWRTPLFVIGLAMLVVAIVIWTEGEQDRAVLLVYAAIGGAAIYLLVLQLIESGARARVRRVEQAQPEMWIGAEGVYCAGDFTPLVSAGCYLITARIAEEPTHRMMLVFLQSQGKSWIEMIRSIPVPRSAEADLDRCQSLLRNCCPKAEIVLVREECR